jgi:hypothetical protein
MFSLAAILAEVFMIIIAGSLRTEATQGGDSSQDGQFSQSQTVSTKISYCIGGHMWLSYIVLVIYRCVSPKLPRRGETIADVAWYVCGSHMVSGFPSPLAMDRMEGSELVRHMEWEYRLGKAEGVDGVV